MVVQLYLLLARYEGSGIWEVIRAPVRSSHSYGFHALVRAHRAKQLCPAEERALAYVGLEHGVFFHVVDVERANALN